MELILSRGPAKLSGELFRIFHIGGGGGAGWPFTNLGAILKDFVMFGSPFGGSGGYIKR